MERKSYVSLAELRAIPPGGERTFYVTSSKKILSARNSLNYIKRAGEIEEGYKYSTEANYEDLSLVVRKIKVEE